MQLIVNVFVLFGMCAMVRVLVVAFVLDVLHLLFSWLSVCKLQSCCGRT